MKRGFTLLELIIVIIIIGILATLGFSQYGRMMERSRGAEARMVCGTLRTIAAGYRLEKASLTGMINATFGIGNATADSSMIPGPTPGNCTVTNYFYYWISGVSGNQVTMTATRCTGGGKTPNATSANTLTLQSDLALGTDIWGGNGSY